MNTIFRVCSWSIGTILTIDVLIKDLINSVQYQYCSIQVRAAYIGGMCLAA